MIVDLFIIFPIIALTTLGFRDGLAKKGLALLVTLIALVLAHLVLNDMATFFVDEFDADRVDAVQYGFFTVFFGLILLQNLIFRVTAHDYKIGGIADRLVGSFFGFLQGLFIMSAVFMMLALQRIPTRTYRIDSRLYSGVANIAPEFLDFALTTVPVTTQEIKEKTGQRVDELTKPQDETPKTPPNEKK